jgi:hypothetical protein
MKKRNWREVAEVVGVVSVVAGLILVAWEIRQSNNIAKAQMVLDLATQANEFNSSRFKSRDVAELAAAMSDPGHTEFTETQESMMAGIAWHFANIFASAQTAYDHGLLGDEDIRMYQASVQWHIENHPGMRPALISIYETTPWIREMFVFEPLVELAEAK